MVLTEVSIANRALALIGDAPIDTLDDINKRAKLCKEFVGPAQEEIIRMYPWNSTTFRARLTRHCGGTPKNITGATQAEPCVITAVAHGIEDLHRVKITDVVGMVELNDITYTARNPETDTFELYDAFNEKSIKSTSYTAYESDGKAAPEDNPVFEYAYHYDLPTGCLRVFRIDSIRPWKVEADLLVTDQDDVSVRYGKLPTDLDVYDPLLVDCMALMLASKLGWGLMHSASVSQDMLSQLETVKLPRAKAVDGQESSLEKLETHTWRLSRH